MLFLQDPHYGSVLKTFFTKHHKFNNHKLKEKSMNMKCKKQQQQQQQPKKEKRRKNKLSNLLPFT